MQIFGCASAIICLSKNYFAVVNNFVNLLFLMVIFIILVLKFVFLCNQKPICGCYFSIILVTKGLFWCSSSLSTIFGYHAYKLGIRLIRSTAICDGDSKVVPVTVFQVFQEKQVIWFRKYLTNLNIHISKTVRQRLWAKLSGNIKKYNNINRKFLRDIWIKTTLSVTQIWEWKKKILLNPEWTWWR